MRLSFALIALTVAATLADKATAASPHFNYMLHCQGCHLPDGAGTPGKIPALIGAGRLLAAEGGREFLVRVPGVSLSTIDDSELAALVNWMLQQFSADDLPADFEPYTAEEVARYRQRPLAEVDKVRARIVAVLEQSAE